MSLPGRSVPVEAPEPVPITVPDFEDLPEAPEPPPAPVEPEREPVPA